MKNIINPDGTIDREAFKQAIGVETFDQFAELMSARTTFAKTVNERLSQLTLELTEDENFEDLMFLLGLMIFLKQMLSHGYNTAPPKVLALIESLDECMKELMMFLAIDYAEMKEKAS